MSEQNKVAEIDAKYLSLYCEAVLGSPLVESDSHDKPEEEGLPLPMMTRNQEFYFVPNYENPVYKTRRGLGKQDEPLEAIPGRYRYGIEIVKCYPGNHLEPDDYDLVEVEQAESINHAIDAAAHHQLDQKLQSIGEGLFWQKENEMEPIIAQWVKDCKSEDGREY